MAQYIDKDALAAEIERQQRKLCVLSQSNEVELRQNAAMQYGVYCNLLSFLNTLEVKYHYEQCVQYDSINAGIQAHAETYSFNIESKLFNQLTKEQQELWRKEIEQACISGGEVGVELVRDTRYKENPEAKEVDLEKEIESSMNNLCELGCYAQSLLDNPDDYEGFAKPFPKEVDDEIANFAKHFFELGLNTQKESKPIEQKTAWSEEDEKSINDIMWIIEAYRKNGFNETHIQMADSSENWLKSLKERVQPQPTK